MLVCPSPFLAVWVQLTLERRYAYFHNLGQDELPYIKIPLCVPLPCSTQDLANPEEPGTPSSSLHRKRTAATRSGMPSPSKPSTLLGAFPSPLSLVWDDGLMPSADRVRWDRGPSC